METNEENVSKLQLQYENEIANFKAINVMQSRFLSFTKYDKESVQFNVPLRNGVSLIKESDKTYSVCHLEESKESELIPLLKESFQFFFAYSLYCFRLKETGAKVTNVLSSYKKGRLVYICDGVIVFDSAKYDNSFGLYTFYPSFKKGTTMKNKDITFHSIEFLAKYLKMLKAHEILSAMIKESKATKEVKKETQSIESTDSTDSSKLVEPTKKVA